MMRSLTNIFHQVILRRNRGALYLAKGILLTILWQFYKRTIGLPVIITTFTGTQFILRPNCITSSRFVYEGDPDSEYVQTLSKYANGNTAFVDVGGNVGLYTALLCQDFVRGWLFEPNSVAANMARRNIAINDAGDRFEVICSAVGKEDGHAWFPILDKPVPTAQMQDSSEGKTTSIAILRLDTFLPDDLDFVVKIDAEGSDADVIKGLEKLFASKRVKVCLFECFSSSIMDQVYATVNRYGYIITDGRPKEIESLKDDERDRNLFIVREDLIGKFTKSSCRV